MKIRIVLARQNSAWVIGKMAERLCAALSSAGARAELGDTPDPSADVNHFMSFAFAEGCPGAVNTMFITHIDDPFKVRLVRELLEAKVQFALCMSEYAVRELRGLGVAPDRLHYVLPALDEPLAPAKVTVGITTRLYDDGRKREKLLLQLAEQMDLSAFRFLVFGSGWERVIPHLRKAGAVVEYDPGSDDWRGDYERIRAAVPGFDYYLYMGMDEGSLGTLDAVSAGVRTIVTAQGFHLQIPGGIDHPFTEYGELREVFGRISLEHEQKIQRLSRWTWDRYAEEHLQIWTLLIAAGPALPTQAQLDAVTRRPGSELDPSTPAKVPGKAAFYLKALSPARIRGAVARMSFLQPLRRRLGK